MSSIVAHDAGAADEGATSTLRRPIPDFIGCAAFLAMAAWLAAAAPKLTIAIVPVLVYEIAAGLVFLIRGRPRASTKGVGPRAASQLGTFGMPLFLAFASAWMPSWVAPAQAQFPAHARWMVAAGAALIAASGALSAWALWHLRRSVSIEPAARGLVTDGPYTFARHPLYAAYLLSFVGLILQRPTVAIFLAVLVWCGLTAARIHYEEALLTRVFPNEYSAYRQRVGRFAPRLSRQRQSTPA